jgi:hypothetical protein
VSKDVGVRVPFLALTSFARGTGIGVRHSLREGRNGESPSSHSLRSREERASGFVTRFARAATASPFLAVTSVARGTGIGVRHSLREGRNGNSPSSLSLRSREERASGFVTRFARAATANPLPRTSFAPRTGSGVRHSLREGRNGESLPRCHFGRAKERAAGSSLASRRARQGVSSQRFRKKRLHLTRREAVRSGHASPRFSRRTRLQGR